MTTFAKALFSALLCISTTFVAFAAGPSPAFGNVDPTGRDVHTMPSVHDTLVAIPGHVHDGSNPWCGTDIDSDEAKANLARIRADRAAGLYQARRKGFSDPDIGDRQVFNVSEEDGWEAMEFELVDKTALYHLWAEISQLDNGTVSPNIAGQVNSLMLQETPSRSLDPGQGIFPNNHDLFGLPPNIDGDGIVDILMYDIGRSGVGGYVSSADQLVDPPEGVGNTRDILYLDAPSVNSDPVSFAAIAAHEYAHLIHLSYGWDATFITEGLAEYAIIANGYYWRSITYMSDMVEVMDPLFSWAAPGSPLDGKDYQRSGLFFTYIAEQTSPEAVGGIMQDRLLKGASGMDSVLTQYGANLSDIIIGFHTANFLNDTSLDPRFGYVQPERSNQRTGLSGPSLNGEVPQSTDLDAFSFLFEGRVNGGSVYYWQMRNVADVSLIYDTPDPTGLFYSEYILRNRARLILDDGSGTLRVVDIDPSVEKVRLDGGFEKITFVLVHENPEIGGNFVTIDADWKPLSQATSVSDATQIPGSFRLASIYPNPFSSQAHLSIALERAGPVRVEIIDMLGRVRQRQDFGVLTPGEHELPLLADTLEPAGYLVRVASGERTDSRLVTLVR